MPPADRCWCGSRHLSADGGGYRRCAACGTWVRSEMPAADVSRVEDEEADLYGRNYWFARQAELGLPDLEERAAADLRARCLHWLRSVLSYKRPPGRALEIGAAHGGFVALLEAAGFDATGVELSPWIADWARRSFGVAMLAGPVEDHDLEPGSFDLIFALDVVEHLQDPLATMRRCVELLHDDGLLILQTPCCPAELDVDESGAGRGRFEEMLIAEHLFLFTEASARRLLDEVGLAHVVTEMPVHETDMFLIGGRRPVRPSEAAEPLPESGAMRIVDALLDLHAAATAERSRGERLRADLDELESRYRDADRDRTARQAQVEELETLFKQADDDRGARLQQTEELAARLRDAERRRAEDGRRIEELDAQYRRADADRVERQRQIDELEAQYRRADADRVERQRQIEALRATHDSMLEQAASDAHRLAELEAAWGAIEREAAAVAAQLEAHKAESQHRAELLEKERSAVDAVREESRRLERDNVALSQRLQGLRALLHHHRNSRLYQAMVRWGRWREFEVRVQHLLGEQRSQRAPLGAEIVEHAWVLPPLPPATRGGAFAFDLTAILPGGENGGAKLVATQLVRGLARLAPDRRFIVLTSAGAHDELAGLDGENVERRLVEPLPTALSELLDEEQLAALLCPMTAPPFDDPRVPLVCLINDLQFLTYPEFFEDADRHSRAVAFHRAARLADHIVTPSDYVRTRVLDHSNLPEERVTTIRHGFSDRFASVRDRETDATLARHGLGRGRYLLFPANFWPHKNHRLLLVAYGLLRERRPDLGLRLVLTGAGGAEGGPVREAVKKMGLDDDVVMPGYVSDAELAGFFAAAGALVFPSLYEGFGIPLVEAFAAGCPVACSSLPSLAELAGDAALYFDPRKPTDIASTLERLLTSPELAATLRRRGRDRLQQLGPNGRVPRAYLELLNGLLDRPRSSSERLAGVFSDGWTTPSLVVAHHGGAAKLELELENPRPDSVEIAAPGVDPVRVNAGQCLALRCVLPPQPGVVELSISPAFRPAASGASADPRRLGLKLWGCYLHRPGTDGIDLLARMADA